MSVNGNLNHPAVPFALLFFFANNGKSVDFFFNNYLVNYFVQVSSGPDNNPMLRVWFWFLAGTELGK